MMVARINSLRQKTLREERLKREFHPHLVTPESQKLSDSLGSLSVMSSNPNPNFNNPDFIL